MLCTHHWVIAAAQGRTSQGVCKLCGQKKRFVNSIPFSDHDWSFVHAGQRDRDDGK
jgi:hypothetical protein